MSTFCNTPPHISCSLATLTNLRLAIRCKNGEAVTLETCFETQRPSVPAPPDRLHSVLTSLVTTSLKAEIELS